MQHKLEGEDLNTLLALYNQQVDTLKAKLLNGETWEQLKQQRINVTELAIALHKYHDYVVPVNPADFPQLEASPEEPVE